MAKVIIEFDYYEDAEAIARMLSADTAYMAIDQAVELVRSRLKYGENISKEEEQTLEIIRDVLNIPTLQA